MPEPPADGPDLDQLTNERQHLLRLAYRLLGSAADAEDVLQETYVRWYALPPAQRERIASPGGWLTTVATRICLDVLGSARVRRERYVGEWLPEPLPGRAEPLYGRPAPSDPADAVTLDESVRMAFLVVLDSLTPAERVAFVLHDVFRYPFADVATIVGRSPEACRQLAVSARRRVRATAGPPTPTPEHAAVVRAFKEAWAAHDVAALVALLDPDVTAVADGGGHATAQLVPVAGADQVARGLVAVLAAAPGTTLVERTVNGRPGLVGVEAGVASTVVAVDVTHGAVRALWVVRNPHKLGLWRD